MTAIPGVFKAEDFFRDSYDKRLFPQTAARIANARLLEIAKDWPVVYGYEQRNGIQLFHGELAKSESDTHTAHLAFVTELKPKECEHEPDWVRYPMTTVFPKPDMFCIKCGVKLKARWELAE